MALHAASEGPGFTTNITMDEQRRDDVSLVEVADESINSLHQSSQRVSGPNASNSVPRRRRG